LYGASAGLNVALVEKDALGGTCLNRGCIPAKAFLETAAVKRHVDHAADFGIDTGQSGEAAGVNFARTQERKQKIVAGLVGGIAAMCKGRKVEVFNGVGTLGAGRMVSVAMTDGTNATITGDTVLLATGSVPRLIPGFERGGPIMTSDEVLDLDTLPGRVAVIGGGAIGCEFASTFADLGSEDDAHNAYLLDHADAGMGGLEEDEHDEVSELAKAYRKQFGFPLIVCAKEVERYERVVANGWHRMANSPGVERAQGLIEIAKIANHRFNELVANANPIETARVQAFARANAH
jgi:pyruvate/2-oxoglutarate dehydrogenase complex dihydrolipoamide dehydrogenase (E3) component